MRCISCGSKMITEYFSFGIEFHYCLKCLKMVIEIHEEIKKYKIEIKYT